MFGISILQNLNVLIAHYIYVANSNTDCLFPTVGYLVIKRKDQIV